MTKPLPIEKLDNRTPADILVPGEEIIDIKIVLNEVIDRLNHIGDANEMVTPPADKAKCPCPCHKGDTDTCFCFCSPHPDEELRKELTRGLTNSMCVVSRVHVNGTEYGELADIIIDFLTANYEIRKKK